ncbi:hypothetical protein SteCoe_21130 [Stentor coeruleus]|uniref:Tubulin/FtsZ GTPase domain-containing protein n=1 Tax=Stentor coeruleus TaxID=5963 RepID=A0A1R2BQA6_9CILI|nr:hypothetical protein SteCoe_21130 [Stentor coeruleus]
MSELLCLHIGQAGIQMGSALHELSLQAHQASFPTNIKPYTPQALFIDLDNDFINQIKSSSLSPYFPSTSFINGNKDTGSLYARGHYNLDQSFRDHISDSLQKSIEKIDNFQGFLMFHSTCGGTGSGCGAYLLESLNQYYPNKDIITFSIYPSPNISHCIVESYNTISCTAVMMEYANAIITINIEGVYNICTEKLEFDMPTYYDVNKIIGQCIYACIGDINDCGCCRGILSEIKRSLVFDENLKLLMMSFSPFVSKEKQFRDQLLVKDITDEVFSPGSCFTKFDEYGKYFGCRVGYRGDVVEKEALMALESICKKKTVKFANCFLDGDIENVYYKICHKKPLALMNGPCANTIRDVCMLSNNTAVVDMLRKTCYKFDKMERIDAYSFWYVGEGMDLGELPLARESVEQMVDEYESLNRL